MVQLGERQCQRILEVYMQTHFFIKYFTTINNKTNPIFIYGFGICIYKIVLLFCAYA